MRKLILLLIVMTGAVLAAPRLLKRAFAPPERDVDATPSDYGLSATDLWIDGPNGKRLHAWWIPAGGPAPVVIVLHGWGGNSGDMLPIGPGLADSGFHSLFLDARRHGQSDFEDFMSMPRFAEDLEAAVGDLLERDDVTGIGVIGHSVGAAASIYAAANNPAIDTVVAVASFAHPAEMMRENFPFPPAVTWALLQVVERMIGHRYDDIAPRNRISDVQVPVMLMHGDADNVIPFQDSIDLHDRLPGSQLVIVPGGTHSDLEAFEPFFPEVDKFLGENLLTAVAPTA
ncbi:MAG: alpha/beta fold hydrolase [Actinomycetota bacterium]|nr:alpha/beta fold hydrolase [Actinomycetota bacterium]